MTFITILNTFMALYDLSQKDLELNTLLLKSNVTFDTFLGITESQSSMSHCLCQTDSTTSSGGGTKRKIANSLISSNLLTAGGT